MRFALIHTYETTSALKHLRLIFSVILFVLCQSTSIYAQDTSSFSSEGNTENFTQTSEKQQSNKHKRSKLYRFFQNFNAIDTTYIEPNHYNFTAMAQASNLLNFYTIYGKNEDIADIERNYRIDDNVMKFITVKMDMEAEENPETMEDEDDMEM